MRPNFLNFCQLIIFIPSMIEHPTLIPRRNLDAFFTDGYKSGNVIPYSYLSIRPRTSQTPLVPSGTRAVSRLNVTVSLPPSPRRGAPVAVIPWPRKVPTPHL